LYSLAPFSDGIKAQKRQIDLLDFTYSNLRLYGSKLTREGVRSILSGNSILGVPLYEHKLCEAHRRLLAKFDDRLDMKLEIDIPLLDDFCSILAGTKPPPRRKGEPLLYHLDFVPVDDDRIAGCLAEAFLAVKNAEKRGAYGAGAETDFCMKAAAVHMGIVKAYPYADGFSELAARAAMQYALMRAGYFPVDIEVSEPEYNTVTAAAIKTGDAAALAGLLRAAVDKKLRFLIDAVKRDQ